MPFPGVCVIGIDGFPAGLSNMERRKKGICPGIGARMSVFWESSITIRISHILLPYPPP
jgi:hypothetical protein